MTATASDFVKCPQCSYCYTSGHFTHLPCLIQKSEISLRKGFGDDLDKDASIMEELKPNLGKNLIIEVGGKKYARFPVRTHVITKDDDILDVAEKYVRPHLQAGDVLFVSERAVAISQGRAYPIKDIKPSRLASFLVKFVKKSPYGIGLGSPWTMELAIREAGRVRIIFAALVSAFTKPFGLRGVFYKMVGKNINAIDGPCDYTLPPYNQYAKLGPRDPDEVAGGLKSRLGCEVVIIDANDLGVTILGQSNKKADPRIYRQIFKDNPLGQATEQTPLGMVREVIPGDFFLAERRAGGDSWN